MSDTMHAVIEREAIVNEAKYSGIAELKIDIANGDLRIEEAELANGDVELRWEYERNDKPIPESDDHRLVVDQHEDTLSLKDERSRRQGWKQSATVTLTIRTGPGIEVAEIDHGNGEIYAELDASGSIDLGNGSIELFGSPQGHFDVNLGNGSLEAEWLLSAGNTTVDVGNGEAEIRLSEGTSTHITANVGIGDIRLPSGSNVERDFLSCAGSGTIGTGEYQLSVDIGNGQITVR